jgi:cysteine desulfurase
MLRTPPRRVEAQMSGGGQERGIRSGTVATHLAVGLGKACEVAAAEMEADSEHVRQLETQLREGIQGQLQGVVLNGPDDPKHRWGLAEAGAGGGGGGGSSGRGCDDALPAQGF